MRCSVADVLSAVGSKNLLGVSGSFGFGRLGILLLRLDFPEFVASQSAVSSDFKVIRRLFATRRSQCQSLVLNFEDGEDHLAEAIRWW